jgi:uncharacterized membrane protein
MSRLVRRRLRKFKKGRIERICVKYFSIFYVVLQKRSFNVHKSIEKTVDIFRVAFISLFLLEICSPCFQKSATKKEKIEKRKN